MLFVDRSTEISLVELHLELKSKWRPSKLVSKLALLAIKSTRINIYLEDNSFTSKITRVENVNCIPYLMKRWEVSNASTEMHYQRYFLRSVLAVFASIATVTAVSFFKGLTIGSGATQTREKSIVAGYLKLRAGLPEVKTTAKLLRSFW